MSFATLDRDQVVDWVLENPFDAADRIKLLESSLRELASAVAPSIKSEGRLSQGLSGALVRARSVLGDRA